MDRLLFFASRLVTTNELSFGEVSIAKIWSAYHTIKDLSFELIKNYLHEEIQSRYRIDVILQNIEEC